MAERHAQTLPLADGEMLVSFVPADHFAFGGYGEHFCLGANLARWEMRSLFKALIPLLPRMEVTAEPERLAGQLHLGGIKRLMVKARP